MENHEIVNVFLRGNAELHRYTTDKGVEISAIYVNGEEIWWHYRSEEAQMVKDWNKEGYMAWMM